MALDPCSARALPEPLDGDGGWRQAAAHPPRDQSGGLSFSSRGQQRWQGSEHERGLPMEERAEARVAALSLANPFLPSCARGVCVRRGETR